MGTKSTEFKIIYGAVLPIAVILLLLGVASFNIRPRLLGSSVSDIFIRLMLCFWFCGLYLRLSRFSSYSFFPNKKWSKTDVKGFEKYFYIGISFLFSLGCGLITWWTIQWFLPNLSNFALVITILNSFIIFLPMATHYWVLKL
jgi:hypothetical protein